jgi:hypothetical protein
MENTEFLPEGEKEPGLKFPNGEGKGPVVDERMRAFARELTDLCDELIVGRVNKTFGRYVVVKTKQGWYMAYNKSYGEGPYIVPDLNDLLQDKTFLIETSGAIRIRRDHRADWTEKLRRFL